MNSSSDSSPPALEYATPSTDEPVLFNRTENGATVVIRDPARRVRAVSDAMSATAGIFLAGMLMGGCVLFSVFGIWETIVAIVIISALVAVGAWLRFSPFKTPVVIELTADDLIFLNLDTKPAPAIPRDRIYAIKFSARSNSLVVYAKGCEIFVHRFSLPAGKVEEIAEFLRLVCNLSEESKTANE